MLNKSKGSGDTLLNYAFNNFYLQEKSSIWLFHLFSVLGLEKPRVKEKVDPSPMNSVILSTVQKQ